MGKRKRSEKDIVNKIFKKVKKLVKNQRNYSESSDDTPISSPAQQPQEQTSDLGLQEEIIPLEPLTDDMAVENQELDPDILELLGSDPTQNKLFGDNLQKDLAMRWKHILLNGLPKEEKVKLLKEYLPAENCTNMKAPALNPEIKSALSESNIKKDSFSEYKQNQMASCISAIGKAMNLALLQTSNVPQDIIKTLSDAGRLLCDTHYRESVSRRFAIINSLSKQKRDVIKNTKIDDNLFGSNLSEHLKTSKAISVSASELRFSAENVSNAKAKQARSTQPSNAAARHPRALNVRGAPRASAAEPRVYPSQSRRPPPPPPPAPREYRQAPATYRPRTNYPQQARRR